MHQKPFGGLRELHRPSSWIKGWDPREREGRSDGNEEKGRRKRGGDGKEREGKERGGKVFASVKIKSWVRPCINSVE